MLRVGFVLRSTEIQPVCFRFVLHGPLFAWGSLERLGPLGTHSRRDVAFVRFRSTQRTPGSLETKGPGLPGGFRLARGQVSEKLRPSVRTKQVSRLLPGQGRHPLSSGVGCRSPCALRLQLPRSRRAFGFLMRPSSESILGVQAPGYRLPGFGGHGFPGVQVDGRWHLGLPRTWPPGPRTCQVIA